MNLSHSRSEMPSDIRLPAHQEWRSLKMKKVLITGISGTLGSALGRLYMKRGWHVCGVTRQQLQDHRACQYVITNAQETVDDALAPNAAACSTGSGGEPASSARRRRCRCCIGGRYFSSGRNRYLTSRSGFPAAMRNARGWSRLESRSYIFLCDHQ